MAYQLNKSDGTLLTEIIDGRIDDATTNLTFIGKNYKGFGEFLNENFIKLLETFANTAPPSKPIKGQLWFDTSTSRLKVYDGVQFRSTDSSILADNQPVLVEGDIWIDNKNKQMYFNTQAGLTLVGPLYTADQLKSGPQVVTIRDTTGVNRTIVQNYVNGQIAYISSIAEFTPSIAINGFSTIKVGINLNSNYNFRFYGTASNSLKLTDETGTEYTKDSFISATSDDTTSGTIHVFNQNGILIGQNSEFRFKVSGVDSVWLNNIEDTDVKIQVTHDDNGDGTAEIIDAIHIQTVDKKVGIFKTNPQYNLDVTGDARITGNLIVEGDVTSLDVATLRVEDKLIELAITSDSTLLPEVDVDGAGVVIRASGDDISWTWDYTTNSWTSSTNIDIDEQSTYKIGGNTVLSKTSLANSVVSAPGLNTIGDLGSLNVDSLNFDGTRITTNSSVGLQIDSPNTIQLVTQQKIANLLAPTTSTDAATKGYVDTQVNSTPLIFSLVIDGMGTGVTLQSNLSTVLEELVPGSGRPVGTQAKIYAVSSSSSTNPIDINSNITKTFVNVDKNGVENQSVVQDFSIGNATATVTTTYTRQIFTYSLNGSNVWTYVSVVNSSI